MGRKSKDQAVQTLTHLHRRPSNLLFFLLHLTFTVMSSPIPSARNTSCGVAPVHQPSPWESYSSGTNESGAAIYTCGLDTEASPIGGVPL